MALLTESSIGENITKGVQSISKGIKWLINKIIEIAKRIKNFIKNIFKPKIEKQLKDMESTDVAVDDALSSNGIKRKQQVLIHVPKPKVSYQKISIDMLANKAEQGHTIKNSGPKNIKYNDANGYPHEIAEIISISNGNAIIKLNAIVINLDEYKINIDRYIAPLIKSKFNNNGLVQAAKLKLGPDADLIPVLRGPYIDSTIDTEDFFPKCNELMDYIIGIMNLPEVKEMENDPHIDPYFSKLLNGLMAALNMINIRMRDIDLCIEYNYKNPYNKFDLAAIPNRQALGKIVEHIMLKSDIKNTLKAYNIIKPFITSVCKVKKWIKDGSNTPSGASRITVLTTDKDKFVYKYAWNRKGIFDNKLDLKIKDVVSKDFEIADRFALPTDESSDNGIYVVVPRSSIRKDVAAHDLNVFNDKLGKDIKNRNMKIIPGDLHNDNIGFLNGKMVVVDYGNFRVY